VRANQLADDVLLPFNASVVVGVNLTFVVLMLRPTPAKSFSRVIHSHPQLFHNPVTPYRLSITTLRASA